MSERDPEVSIGVEIQDGKGIRPIDVASQHVKGSIEWLVETLRKGEELSPEMKEILAKQAQQLLSVFVSYSQDISEIPQQSSEVLSSTWFEKLKAKVESGEIPKYRGKKIDDIDPIRFTYKWYLQYINAGLLMQWHLRILDSNLIIHLNSHIRYEKSQNRLPYTYTVADVVPTSKKISDKLLLG